MKKITLIISVLISLSVSAQTIELDNDFGDNGFSTLNGNTGGEAIINTIIQNSGKIVISGSRINGSNCCENFLARLNADGSLDTGFADNGYYVVSAEGEVQSSIFKLGNNEILLLVYDDDNKLMKLNNNGMPDTSFGTNGVVNFENEEIGSLIVENNYAYFTINFPDKKIKKLNLDSGNLDSNFGNNGTLTTSVSFDYINGVTENTLLLAEGESNSSESFEYLLSLNFDGTLDNTFADNGYLLLYSASNPSDLDNLNHYTVLDENQNIYVIVSDFGDFSTTLKKYDPEGNLNTGFGTSGTANLPTNVVCQYMVLKNGKIYLVGGKINGGNLNLALVKYDENGELDQGFNDSGFYIEDNNSLNEHGESISIDEEGKIIIGGEYENGNTNKIFAAKYLGNNLSTKGYDFSDQLYFKNPIENNLEFHSTRKIDDIRIYDINGRYIKSKKGNKISTSDLTSGIYFAKINFENGIVLTKKIVKK